MKRSDYIANPESLKCGRCGSKKTALLESEVHKGGGVVCMNCRQFVQWLSKDQGKPRRELLKAGTLDDVWTAWGDRCAHCGALRSDLPKIKAHPTVQHAPPYKLVGHEACFIPYCSWCQEDSAKALRRMEILLDGKPTT